MTRTLEYVRIDPHTHSDVSDGTDRPADVVAAAAAAGLDVVGLTDHDTTAGWAEAAEAARRHGVALLRGIELTARAAGRSVHVLAYLPDPQDPGLVDLMARARTERVDRAREMVDRLAVDVPITWADVEAHTEPGATVGRPHIADALVGLGLVAALVGALVVGLASGLVGFPPSDRAVPLPADSASPTGLGTPTLTLPPATPSATPRPSPSSAPSTTPSTGGPVVGAPPPPADEGCAPAPTDPTVLSDGQVALTVPADWMAVDSLTWLDCSTSAASTAATASVTVGLSPHPGGDLQEVAEATWSTALLDAGVGQPLTMTSAPTRVADMAAWSVTGTIAIEDELDELTVIAIGSGEHPTIVVTSASSQDAAGRQAVADVLSTVRRA